MLASVECGPGDSARVLALQEKRFGLAILETEDLAVTTDVELALQIIHMSAHLCPLVYAHAASLCLATSFKELQSTTIVRIGNRVAPCPGRSFDRRMCPRRYA